MDTTDKDITFDSNGVCTYCNEFKEDQHEYQFSVEQSQANLKSIAEEIRRSKTGQYDCIIGLSGGVDSSYVCYLAWKMGLKPLCVHFDNGWNSEIAVANIKKMLKVTGFHYETHVINWPEFKDLQRSFFKAGVLDIEMLTDHAIMATMFGIRKQHNIRYVLSGANFATEHGMPPSWLWSKQDLTNIKAIQKKFGTKKIRDFPTMGFLKYMASLKLKTNGIYVTILNHINYNKEEAMRTLMKEFDWKYYGGKHYESVFTKFYQAYILPRKFNIDKRKVHLSSQIRNGEISREFALQQLKEPLYSEQDLANDKAYIIKKLGFKEDEFNALMKEKPVPHDHYPSDIWMMRLWHRIKSNKKGKLKI
jgi:N-acetyl sugar amidotransferase